MTNSDTKVIAFRVNNDAYERLRIRALRKHIKMGTYIREFMEKELYRHLVGLDDKSKIEKL